MVDITIDELLDGETIRQPTSQGILSEDNITYKGSIAPNPTRVIHAINQAQLEEALGVDLIIPDGTSISVVIDDAFTLNKPFKIGNFASFEIVTYTMNTLLTYTGTGGLIQNENPANPVVFVTLENIKIDGNGTSTLFDLFGVGLLRIEHVTIQNFDSLGTIEMFSIFSNASNFNVINKGLVIIRTANILIFVCTSTQSSATGLTLFSIISDGIQTNTSIDVVRAFTFFAGDSLLFLDPNAPVGSIYYIDKSDAQPGDLYQLGTDIAINSVADSSGQAEFTTAAPHGLIVGKPVVLSGFSESTYNVTDIVSVVNSPTTFELRDVSFVATDTGNMNTASKNQTDSQVLANENEGIDDSMFIAEVGLQIFGSEISSSSLAQDTFEIITSGAWVFSTNLERFAENTSNEGEIIVTAEKTRKYSVTYDATIEKSGGGSVNIGIILIKNGVTNVSFNAPHTVNTGKIQVGRTNIVELAKGDTLQIAVINYDASATAILISQVNLVVSL